MKEYYSHNGITIYHGDCLQIMHEMPDQSVDAVITDPPYGIGKAEWDRAFPTEWYFEATRRIAERVVIISDSRTLAQSILLVGADYIDTIAGRNLNGMTFSPIGFGNWIAAVIAKGKPRQGTNCFEFSVRGAMPEHPCPKPIEYMLKLVERVTDEGETILDPFMGSGTTLVAAKQLGRKCVGIEISQKYCDIAIARLQQEVLPMSIERDSIAVGFSEKMPLPLDDIVGKGQRG